MPVWIFWLHCICDHYVALFTACLGQSFLDWVHTTSMLFLFWGDDVFAHVSFRSKSRFYLQDGSRFEPTSKYAYSVWLWEHAFVFSRLAKQSCRIKAVEAKLCSLRLGACYVSVCAITSFLVSSLWSSWPSWLSCGSGLGVFWWFVVAAPPHFQAYAVGFVLWCAYVQEI